MTEVQGRVKSLLLLYYAFFYTSDLVFKQEFQKFDTKTYKS